MGARLLTDRCVGGGPGEMDGYGLMVDRQIYTYIHVDM